VIKEVNHKLIRRHPHVFDKTHTRFKSADQVLKNWESIKQQEKGKSKNFSLPKYMPATLALHILLDKLQRFGVYSCDKHKLIFSIKERIKNLDEEIKDNKNITNLILDLINLVRLCGYDAESLLREKVKELQEILINSS
jgi:tetrapyrrole methylase family protein/MazG family protein